MVKDLTNGLKTWVSTGLLSCIVTRVAQINADEKKETNKKKWCIDSLPLYKL